MNDQLINAGSMPEFTPDTIQHLRDVRQKMLDNASKAREQEMAWMNRATQWDVFIRQAEAHAQPTSQAWQQDAPVEGEVSP